MASRSISHLLRQLDIHDDGSKIQARAAYVLTKLPASVQDYSSAKPALAVQVACQLLSVDFNEPLLIRMSGIKPKDYKQAISQTLQHLNIAQQTTFQELAVRTGCNIQIPQTCAITLELLQERWGSTLNAAMRDSVQWHGSVMITAIFWWCCKNMGVSIEKSKLAAWTGASIVEVNRVIKILDSYCKSIANSKSSGLVQKVQQTTSVAKGRKRRTSPDMQIHIAENASPKKRVSHGSNVIQEAESPIRRPSHQTRQRTRPQASAIPTQRPESSVLWKHVAASGICSMITPAVTNGKRYEEFCTWKDSLLNKIEASV